uniref:Tuftelin 1 n=1 Tax=Otus sunia TaxID=257818 RepID=A0A8C8BMB7_9STRI
MTSRATGASRPSRRWVSPAARVGVCELTAGGGTGVQRRIGRFTLRELENSPPGLSKASARVPEAALGAAFLCESARRSLERSRANPSSRCFCPPQPVGKAFAMVANRSSNGHSLASECIKSNDGDEEIIKVYLKARAEGGGNHEEHVNQLKSEVRYIQEVVLEKQNGSWLYPERLRADSWEDQEEEEECSGEDVEKIRQTAKRLFTKLQEAEKRHQLEKKAFERTVSQYQEEAEQASSALRRAERSVVEKEVQVDELQRLLAGMEKEHRSLLLRMKEGEAELARLRSVEGDKLAEQDRSAQLEKEVAMLREKIHHLDDMLKSQQRKVRQMIEQLQNSKTVIQAKDAVIQELKERVAYLEAENLEMHDRIEHLIEKQVSRGGHSSRARSKSEYVSSKRPTGPKPLPLIRVVET